MDYIKSISDILFPGTSLVNLRPEQSHRIIQHITRIHEASKEVVEIPELLSRIVKHLPIKLRESVRGTCSSWNIVVTEVRTSAEINLHVPVRRNTTHLGVAARNPTYIQWVHTQEEFNLLWPAAIGGVILPPPEFVTPAASYEAHRIAQKFRQSTAYYVWILGLPYYSFEMSVGYSFGPMRNVDRIEAGEELCRQSREGCLDVRKIVHLYKYGFDGDISNAISFRYRNRYSESSLYTILTVCPELAIFNHVYCGWNIYETDCDHGESARRLDSIPKYKTIDIVQYQRICDGFMRKSTPLPDD